MLKFLTKSFSKRQSPNYVAQDEREKRGDGIGGGSASSSSFADFHILMLDGETQKLRLSKRTLGCDLFDKVCFNLELIEKDFFGLQYIDSDCVCHWVDPSKKVKKQVPISKNNLYVLFFKVKFFPTQPNSVKEERTKYYFYWQLKTELSNGALPVAEELSIQLAALNVQSELGDFDSSEHDEITISEFRFVPEQLQSEFFERQVFITWIRLKGLNPAQCEEKYIEKLKDNEMYGVSMHEVLGKDGNLYKLGLTPFGMLIYDGDERIGLFLWQKMDKLAFNKKQLVIQVLETDASTGTEKLHSFQFTLRSSKSCKHLWKCAIEFHTFYRLCSSSVTNLRQKQSFVRMQSKFRYSGRTESQLRASAKAPQPRRQIQFQRRPSRRYSRRESHRIRERILSQSQTNVSERLNSSNNNPKDSPHSQLSLNLSSHAAVNDPKRVAKNNNDQNLIEFSPISADSKSIGYISGVVTRNLGPQNMRNRSNVDVPDGVDVSDSFDVSDQSSAPLRLPVLPSDLNSSLINESQNTTASGPDTSSGDKTADSLPSYYREKYDSSMETDLNVAMSDPRYGGRNHSINPTTVSKLSSTPPVGPPPPRASSNLLSTCYNSQNSIYSRSNSQSNYKNSNSALNNKSFQNINSTTNTVANQRNVDLNNSRTSLHGAEDSLLQSHSGGFTQNSRNNPEKDSRRIAMMTQV